MILTLGMTLGSSCFDICFEKRKKDYNKKPYANDNLNKSAPGFLWKLNKGSICLLSVIFLIPHMYQK